MEESLKARLIGAVVLVALAVLLIPELLSGRKAAEPVAEEGAGSRGTRSFTIELGQAAGPGARSAVTTAVPAPGAAEPGAAPVAAPADTGAEPPTDPAATKDSGAAAAAAPATVPQVPQSTPPAVTATPDAAQRTEPKSSPAPNAAGGGWAVQVGAFGSADTARKLTQELGAAGYRAFVSPVNRAGKTLYRVRVGPVGDRAGAEQLVPRLKARGLPTTVVQND
jgi:cell division septation protein DedD